MEPKNSIEIVVDRETSRADQTHGVATADQTVEAGGLQETSNQGGQRKVSMMPKVLPYIRQNQKEDFDPLVATFGPYSVPRDNARDDHLELVENFKDRAVEWFVDKTGKNANFWFDKVWDMVQDLRRCYTKESVAAYSNAELARMFFRDACLAILVIGVPSLEDLDISIAINELGVDNVMAILRDSLLLENQLPFWFVKELLIGKFGVEKGEARWRTHFKYRTESQNIVTVKRESTGYWDEDAGEPAHFLEALKIAMLSGKKKKKIKLKHDSNEEKERVNRLKRLKRYYAIHSVTELHSKGIILKPNSTNSFKDVTFESNCYSGTLRFPVDHVDYGSKATLSNIIAYEMSPDNRLQDYTITAYVHVMKSLLQSPKDVYEIQAHGIIINMLGSNEQVMNIYKDIYTIGASKSLEYTEICHKMQDHYNNTAKTWVAELVYTYFRSPWTIIALFGSILVVILTLMQTYYAASDDNKGFDARKSLH